MQSHDAVDHDDEGGDEEDEDGLLAPVEVMAGAGSTNGIELGEVLAVLIGVRERRIGLDLLGIPVQVCDDRDTADDKACGTPADALEEVDARGVRCDDGRNGLIVENVVPIDPARKMAPTQMMES